MMDASHLVPEGFHPQRPHRTLDFSRDVVPLRRSKLKVPVRYYFIDFGLSSWFRNAETEVAATKETLQPADKSLRQLVRGNVCQDPFVSELNTRKPYDPFMLDMGILGNVIKVALVDVSIRLNLHVII